MLGTATLDATEVSYETLTELSAVEAVASAWNALLARSACNRAFGSAQWFIAACRSQPQMSPYVIVARRGTALAAILPLVLIHKDMVATFASDESDYNDIVAAPDEMDAVACVLTRALSPNGGYQRLILSNLRDDSNCLRAVQLIKPDECMTQQDGVETSCPFIKLPPSYDDYLMTQSKSFRAALRQVERYAERDGVLVRELNPENFSPTELPNIFLLLHLSRFADCSPLASANAQAFIHEVFPTLFTERRLRAFALFEAEKIVAINACMVGVKSLCLWNGGFTAEAERFSPGTLLINAGIRRAYDLHMDEYDFMRGDEPYKSRWANQERGIVELEFKIRD
jgi:CelD/BcsL family acetyltransferase involved in cellulose biosynthesis